MLTRRSDEMRLMMENTNLLVKESYFYEEYLKELESFRDMIVKLVMDDSYDENENGSKNMVFHLQQRANENNVLHHESIRRLVSSLRKLEREVVVQRKNRVDECERNEFVPALDFNQIRKDLSEGLSLLEYTSGSDSYYIYGSSYGMDETIRINFNVVNLVTEMAAEVLKLFH